MAVDLIAVEARHLEVGRQRHLQHVDLLVRRADRLRVRAAQRHGRGIEAVPHGGIGIGGLQRVIVQAGDALHVGQRRHVHDRHAGHARLRDRIEQLAHAGRAILRLLHGEADEIVVLRIDAGGAAGGDLARQLARVELDRILAAPDRQADAEALRVDQVGLGRKAYEMELMAAEQELGGQKRPVGRAHDQDVVCRRHSAPAPCRKWKGGEFRPVAIRLGPAMLLRPPSLCNAQRRTGTGYAGSARH